MKNLLTRIRKAAGPDAPKPVKANGKANGHAKAEPGQYLTIAQAKARDAELLEVLGWALGAMTAELNQGSPSRSHLFDLLARTANTAERANLLRGIRGFDEDDVPRRTQADYMRYQSTGRW